MFNIRDITSLDVVKLKPLLVEHFYETDMDKRGESLDDNKLIPFLYNLISHTHKTLVAEKDNQILGIISFIMNPSPFNYDKKNANEVLWYVSKELGSITRFKLFSRLFEHVLMSLSCEGITAVNVGIPMRSRALEKYLRKQGFNLATKFFTKEIKEQEIKNV